MLAACLLSLIVTPITVSAKTVTKYVEMTSKDYYFDVPSNKWVWDGTTTNSYSKKGVITKSTYKSTYAMSPFKRVTTYKNGKMDSSEDTVNGKTITTTKYKYNKKGLLSTEEEKFNDATYKITYTYDSKGNVTGEKEYSNSKQLSSKTKYVNKYTKKGVLSKVTATRTNLGGEVTETEKTVTTYYTSGVKKGLIKKSIYYNSDGEKSGVETYSYTFDKNKNLTKAIMKYDGWQQSKTIYTYQKIKYKK